MFYQGCFPVSYTHLRKDEIRNVQGQRERELRAVEGETENKALRRAEL